jgi:hypothetical protein
MAELFDFQELCDRIILENDRALMIFRNSEKKRGVENRAILILGVCILLRV